MRQCDLCGRIRPFLFEAVAQDPARTKRFMANLAKCTESEKEILGKIGAARMLSRRVLICGRCVSTLIKVEDSEDCS